MKPIHKLNCICITVATILLVSLCAVSVNPLSVNAAGGSSTNVQAPAKVGASVASAPAASAPDTNSSDLFVQGTDNALWYKHYQSGSGWSSWKSLGGALSSSPAAVSRPNGKIDVFVRGTDGAVWTRATTDGGSTWSGWKGLGGALAAGTGPAAYAWGDTRIGWMVTGTDNKLWHMWTDSSGTHGWESLGGALSFSPGVTSQTSGSIDVFVQGTDAAVWQRTYANNTWGNWKGLSGQLASGSGPAASSWGNGRLDLFVQGTDNIMWHKSYTGTWSAWGSLGGALSASPAAAASGGNRIDVFVRGTDNGLWEKSYNGGWGGWTSVSGIPQTGTPTIFYVPQAGSTWANQGAAGASYDAYVSNSSLFRTQSNGYSYWGDIGQGDYIYVPAGSATDNQNVASWEIGFHFAGVAADQRYQKIWDKAYGGFSIGIDTGYGADSSYLVINRVTTNSTNGANGINERWYIPQNTVLRAGHNYYVQISWDSRAGPGNEPYPTIWIGEDGNAPVHQTSWDESAGALDGTGSWHNDSVGGVNLGNTASDAGSNTSAKTAWLVGGLYVYRQYDSIVDFSSGGSWQTDKLRWT